MTRDERQDLSVERYLGSNSEAPCGTVQAVTGFGKTRIGIKIINLLRRNDSTRHVIISVPTVYLKEQWESELRKYNVQLNTEVIVVNSIIKRRIKCSLLIIDEIHRFGADTFSNIFEVVQYSFILGLTATMRRLDGKHRLLIEKCPIVDVITLEEARKNKWIAPYNEYNLGIEMSDSERERYRETALKFQKMFDKFNNDFETMKACSSLKIFVNQTSVGLEYKDPKAVRLARSYGWTGNSALRAYRITQENLSKPRGQKENVWGGNVMHPYHPDKLCGFAVNGMRLMREVKEFIYGLPSKIDAAIETCNAFSTYKTITFAEIIDTAEEIARRLGDKAVVYHSKIKAKIIDGKKTPGTVVRKQALERFRNHSDTLVIATARALDQGADFPEIRLGITLSRTTNPIQQTQRRGRVARKVEYEDGTEKSAIFVNIYVKDTKDVNWLGKAQKNDVGVIWVDSVQEILQSELSLAEEIQWVN